MSTQGASAIPITAGLNNASYIGFEVFNNAGAGIGWNNVKNGVASGFGPTAVARPASASTSALLGMCGFEYFAGKGNVYVSFHALITLDVSAITKANFPNGIGEVYMNLGSANRRTFTGAFPASAADVRAGRYDRFCFAKPNATLQAAINSAGVGYSPTFASDFNAIDGWAGNNVDNSSNITLYADLDQTIYYGPAANPEPKRGVFTDVSTGTTMTMTPFIKLNSNAVEDIFNNDFFVVWMLDYDYWVRNRDPNVHGVNPGTDVRIATRIGPLADGNAGRRGGGAYSGRLTFFSPALESSQPAAPDVIANDFTFNTFADVSDQRARIFKTTGLLVPNQRPDLPDAKNITSRNIDQVPFLLGVKGPLSLRGREFNNQGIPISITVDPPRAKKDSKS